MSLSVENNEEKNIEYDDFDADYLAQKYANRIIELMKTKAVCFFGHIILSESITDLALIEHCWNLLIDKSLWMVLISKEIAINLDGNDTRKNLIENVNFI